MNNNTGRIPTPTVGEILRFVKITPKNSTLSQYYSAMIRFNKKKGAGERD
jgi:hypothetical protein